MRRNAGGGENRRRALAAAILAVIAACRVEPAAAHAVGMSRGEYRLERGRVRAELVLSRPELLASRFALDADHDGTLARDELARARPELDAWVLGGVEVSVASGSCAAGRVEDASLTDEDAVRIVATYDCAGAAASFTVRLPLLHDLSLGHRHLATASAGGTVSSGALRRRAGAHGRGVRRVVARVTAG